MIKVMKALVYFCLILLFSKESDSNPNNIYFNGVFHNIHHLTVNSFSVQTNSTSNSTHILPESANQSETRELTTSTLPLDGDDDGVTKSNSEEETGEYTLTKEEEFLVFHKGIDIDYSHNESLEDAPNKQFISAPGCPA